MPTGMSCFLEGLKQQTKFLKTAILNTIYPQIKSLNPLLLVTELRSALDFYTTELGFEIDFVYEDFYAGIKKDGYTIHLKSGQPNKEERANRRKNEDLDLTFLLDNINEFFEAIVQRSPGIIVQPLRDMPYGREFYIADPDGYILGFLETE